MKSKSGIGLIGVLVLMVCGMFLWNARDKPTAENVGVDVAAFGHSAPSPQPDAAGHRLAFRQPRLTADQRQRLEADPGAALAAGPGNLDLLVAWAARDPDAALAWINAGHNQSHLREGLLGAIAAGILIKEGPEAMQRFIDGHQEDPAILPKNRGELLRHVFFNLGREDSIEAALKLLEKDSVGSLAGTMVLGVDGASNQTRAIDYLEAKGLKVAVDYWSFQATIDNDPRYWADWAQQRDSGLLAEIVQSWARSKPDEARAWLDQQVPVGDPRRAR